MNDLASKPKPEPMPGPERSGGPWLVQTVGLCKRYGDFDALSDCSVRVRRGEIFGLLGPNGSGKTTLIRLVLGHLHPSGGRCEVDGLTPTRDGVAVRRLVAYLPGDARLPRHMRGSDVLRFFAEIHPHGDLQRSKTIADTLELDLRVRVAFMSTGMRQKLALAVVLGLDTPLLILDEPTANLDPTIRATVMKLVCEARTHGRTVIFSSHVLSEIEEACDRVAFLRRGKLVHELTMSDLLQRHRITADPPRESVHVPQDLSDRVIARTLTTDRGSDFQIDTTGDLAPLLGWIDSLALERLRIEPLGLRAVYDSVHHGHECIV